MVRRMKNLEVFNLTVKQVRGWSDGADQDVEIAAMQPILDCLKVLGRLPLKNVTVVVTDKNVEDYMRIGGARYIHVGRLRSRCWTVNERREWAKGVNKAIFGEKAVIWTVQSKATTVSLAVDEGEWNELRSWLRSLVAEALV